MKRIRTGHQHWHTEISACIMCFNVCVCGESFSSSFQAFYPLKGSMNEILWQIMHFFHLVAPLRAKGLIGKRIMRISALWSFQFFTLDTCTSPHPSSFLFLALSFTLLKCSLCPGTLHCAPEGPWASWPMTPALGTAPSPLKTADALSI